MNKKFIILAIILVFITAIFAACGQQPPARKEILIKYMSDGELYKTGKGVINEELTFPDDPVKEGFIFLGWYLDAGTYENEFTTDYLKNVNQVNSPLEVYAKWEAEQPVIVYLELTRESQDENMGTVSGASGQIAFKQVVSVTATPKTGYEFTGWYEGTKKVSDKAEYTFGMPARDYHLTAAFAPSKFNLIVESEDLEKGGVTGDKGDISFGTLVAVNANPNEGYSFEGWYEDGVKIFGEAYYTFTMEAAPRQITARFLVNTYNLSIASEDENKGTVSGVTGEIPYKQQRTVTAAALTGYSFNGWFEGETKVSENASYTFNMPARAYNLTAKFSVNSYNLTVNSEDTEKGAVSGDSGLIAYGGGVTVRATANTGYSFEGWFENGIKVSNDAVYQFNMPYNNRALTARFTVNNYDLTVVNLSPQKGSVNEISGQKPYKTQVTLTATANNGYAFAGWYQGETKVSEEASYSFNMPASDISIRAEWSIVEYAVTFDTAGGAFAADFTPVSSFNIENAALTLPPAEKISKEGHTFVKWFLTGDEQKNEVLILPSGSWGDKHYTAYWSVNSYDFNFSLDERGTATGTPGIYNFGAEITVEAEPFTGYSFDGWYEGETKVSEDLIYTFNLPARNYYLDARFIPIKYTLTVKSNNTGRGLVSTPGGQIDFNTEVTVTAQPKTGYSFDYWKVNGVENHGIGAVYSFTMPANDVSLEAFFVANTYTLTVISEDFAKGGVSDTASDSDSDFRQEVSKEVTYGRSIKLYARGFGTFILESWYVQGQRISAGTELTFTPPHYNVTITAKWIDSPDNIDYETDGGNFIEGYSPPVLFNSTSPDIFLPTAEHIVKEGHTFIKWYLADDPTQAEQTVILSGSSGDRVYKALWSINIYTLSVSHDASMGTVSGDSGEFLYGTEVSVQAVPDEGYSFNGWYLDGELVSALNNYTFILTGDTAFTARFSINSYTFTAVNNYPVGGSIQAESGPVTYGTEVTVLAQPNEGYYFMGWYIGDTAVSEEPEYTFNMPSSSLSLEARWNTIKYTVEYELDGGSFVSGYQPVTIYNIESETKTLPLSENINKTGHTFVKWYLEGDTELTPVTAIPTGTVGNKKFIALWSANSYTLTVSTANFNLGEVSDSSGVYDYGEEITVYASARPGNTFIAWYDQSIKISEDMVYTFTMPARDLHLVAYFSPAQVSTKLTYQLTDNGYYVSGINGSEYDVIIPSAHLSLPVIGIKPNAFENKNINSVFIPSSIYDVQEGAFNNSNRLVRITTADDSPYYSSEDGILYNKDKTQLISYPAAKVFNYLNIAASVTTIKGRAFYNAAHLDAVCIHAGVTAVEALAFDNCSSLVIFTEATAKPAGWAEQWKADNIPVYWDYSTIIDTGDASYKENATGLTLVKYYGDQEDFAVPSVVDGRDITAIGMRAFKGNSALRILSLPVTVTDIGSEALMGCALLSSISLGNGLKTVGDRAFSGLTELSSLTLPASVTHIGTYAFSGLTKLTGIVIPQGLISIGLGAFSGCNNITEITLPFIGAEAGSAKPFGYIFGTESYGSSYIQSIYDYDYYIPYKLTTVTLSRNTAIPNRAFEKCRIVSVVIPADTAVIGEFAFKECTNLQNITLPDSLTILNIGVFYECYSLETIVIPRNVSVIEDWAFLRCTNLREVSVSPGGALSEIWDAAFSGCQNLESIDFADCGLTIIGFSCFSDCSKLNNVNLPLTVNDIGASAFDDCVALENINIPSGVTVLPSYVFYNCGLREFIAEDSIFEIQDQAFANCKNLETVFIGNVETVGQDLFDNCNKVKIYCRVDVEDMIEADAWSENWNSGKPYRDNISSPPQNNGEYIYFISSGGVYLEKYLGSDTDISIPDKIDGHNVTSICSGAFSGNTSVSSVYIPTGISGIESGAFSDSEIKEIYCYSDSKPGGWEAGWNPGNTVIYWNILSKGQIDGYKYAVLRDETAKIIQYTGSGGGIQIPSEIEGYPVTALYDSSFRNNASITSVTLPESLISIGRYAFSGTAFTSVTIPSPGALEYIGEYAFSDNTGLTEIILPDTLTSVGTRAFFGCVNLKIYYRLPSAAEGFAEDWNYPNISVCWDFMQKEENEEYIYAVTNLGNAVILEYKNDTPDYLIPDTINEYPVTSIFEKAYKNKSFSAIEIPAGITYIGKEAFSGCYNLLSVTFAENSQLDRIDDMAFVNCNQIVDFAVPDSVSSMGSGIFKGCYGLKNLTVPFVGAKREATGGAALFGYIFGTDNYLGSKAVYQYYNNTQYIRYYIPSLLETVTVTDGSAILPPDRVHDTELSYGAFYGCTMLKEINIAPTVINIGDKAFFGCSGITALDFGGDSHLAGIGSYAFAYCTALQTIYFGHGVMTTGPYLFEGCGSLSVYLRGGMAGSEWHEEWNSANRPVTYNVTHYGTIDGLKYALSDGSIHITGYSGNQSVITLPTSVIVDIEEEVIIPADPEDPESVEEVIIVVTPTAFAVTMVAPNAFENNQTLTGINIPSNIERIMNSAFADCAALVNVNFAEDGTTLIIERYAFKNCASMYGIYIPDYITVKDFAFEGCAILSIFCEGQDLSGWGMYWNSENRPFMTDALWFDRYSVFTYGLKDGEGLYIVGVSGQAAVTEVPSVIQRGGVSYNVVGIYDKAFYGITDITRVIIYPGILTIGQYAFYGCSSLTEIVLPDTITEIGYAAFSGLNNLVSITLPFVGKSRTAEGGEALFGYIFGEAEYQGGSVINQLYSEGAGRAYYIPDSLKNVTITDTGTLKYGAFYGCFKLESVILPDNLTSIGDRAFYDCSALMEIVIPLSVSTIADYAFRNCSSLTIYCEAAARPEGFSELWNYSECPVIWGYSD